MKTTLFALLALFALPLWAQTEPAKPEPVRLPPVKLVPLMPLIPVGAALPAVPAVPAVPMMRPGSKGKIADASAEESEGQLLVRAFERARGDFFQRFQAARAANTDFDTQKEDPMQFYRPLLRRAAGSDFAALEWCVENAEWMPPARAGEADDHAAARTQFRADLERLLGSKDPAHLTTVANCALGHATAALTEADAFSLCERALATEHAPKAQILAAMAAWNADNPGAEYLARAEALYVRAQAAHPDEKLAARITGALFAMRNLREGHTAPELEGVDLAGKPLKLSDYKGRVVFLEFWGFW